MARKGKPGVVHGTEIRAYHEQNRTAQRLEKVYEKVFFRDGDEEAAGTFYNKGFGKLLPLV